MACAYPLKIKNNSKYIPHTLIKPYIEVPCGYCLNCRVDRRNFLEDCCNYEYKKRGVGTFLTLTYSDEELLNHIVTNEYKEPYATLSIRDSQLFIKRLRRYINYHSDIQNEYCQKDFKYIAVGEYGDANSKINKPDSYNIVNGRPHLHLLIFGLDFNYCKSIFQKCWNGSIIESDPILQGGIRYVLKYLDKQQKGKQAKSIYYDNGIIPPFSIHSVGLGAEMFTNNLEDIKKNNWTYKTKHNLRRPIPTYYKNKFLGVSHEIEYEKNKQLLKDYKIPFDTQNKNYKLTTINTFKHELAKIRHDNLVEKSLQQGESVYIPDKFIKDIPKNPNLELIQEYSNILGWTFIDNELIPF